MAIFIKLLATNMVASSFFGRSKRDVIKIILLELSASAVSISPFFKENSATSAPDIKAEHKSKMKSKTKLTRNEVFISKNISNKLLGSGSKIISV